MKQSANTFIFTRERLTQFLFVKSVTEALLVIALAVGFYLVFTSPHLEGSLEHADSQTVAGWAVNERSASARVEVQLFIDDRFIEHRHADGFRPDLRQTQRAGDDWHGFVFKTPMLPFGEHEARVYAVHSGSSPERRTLQIIGEPLRFRVEPSSAQVSSGEGSR